MNAPESRPRLLFIYLKKMPFVADDLRMLREAYDVRTFHFDASQAKSIQGLVTLFVRQLKWLLRELPRADLVYGWFADYHLVLPLLLQRLNRVPVVVALGGFECNHIPSLEYGVFDSWWRGRVATWIYRSASCLLPVSETLIFHQNEYAAYPDVLANGVRAHVSDLKTPMKVIPFGFDPEKWPLGLMERAPVVTTVAFIRDERTLRVKGVDLLIDVARELPEVRFNVVGVDPAFKQQIIDNYKPPKNIGLQAPRPREELSSVYGKTSVYAQLSRTEGLPNVVAEAMCCGCIPVGSRVAGIPELIGDTGVVVDAPVTDQLVAAVRRGLGMAAPDARQRARQRIVENYALDQRKAALYEVVEHLCNTPRF